MSFGHGFWLHLLWLIPMAGVLLIWAQGRARRDLRRLLGPGASAAVAPKQFWRRRAWALTLTLVALGLGIFALAQPRWGHEWREQEMRGLEIVLALDVSRSMDAEDVDPSRIERARREAQDLIEAMPTSRIGLVLFAGGAYPRMPQTLDHLALRDILNRTDTQTIRAQGSSMAAALQEARGLMDLENESDRAILLLSDGESWDADLSGELVRLSEEGIRVYSVGIGSTTGAPIPNEGGGFKKTRSGEVVMTKLDDSSLKKIASETGGAYVQSTGGASDTREIVAALNRQLAVSAQGQRREKVWNERFQWPLGFAVALLFCGTLFSGRRRGLSGLLLAMGLLGASPAVWAQDAQVDVRNPRDLWSLADSHFADGRYEEAYRGFVEVADRAIDSELRKGARYNAGNAAYAAGKLEEALTSWDRVLEMDPNFEPAQRNAEAVRQELAQRLQEEPPPEESPEDAESSEDSEEDSGSDQDEQDSESQDSDQGSREDEESEESDASEEGQREEGEEEAEEPESDGEMPELAEGGGEEEDQAPEESAPLAAGVQEMSGEEAMRLLEGVEEGKPYVVVGGESSEKDW